MIHLSDKSRCCGCTACVAVCPKQCIRLVEDEEGFLYPKTDASICVDCKLCEKRCPELSPKKERMPLSVYAMKNKDEQIRLASSSGGIFTLLASKVIEKGGVVFGARFNEQWEVVHDYTETKDGLAPFRGSKYVQSHVGDCYRKVNFFLQQGRKVMFTGTPCQIAGLKNFLGKEYDALLTVDVVCHGVPSPKVWRIYIDEIARKGGKNSVLPHSIHERDALIKGISFRDKRLGWKKYSFALTLSEATADGEQNTVLLSSVFSENPYMQVFLSNLSLRPSCYACPAKAGRSGSDITIADFWGIEDVLPEFDDDKGISLVLSYSDKGEILLQGLEGVECRPVDYLSGKKMNPSMAFSVNKHINRNFFFRQLNSGRSLSVVYEDCFSHALGKRIYRFLYRAFKF